MLKQYKLRNYHFPLIIYVCALCIIGILLIGSARESLQNKQIFGFMFGLILMIAFSLFDYSYITKFYIPIYAGTIILLVWVEFFGRNVSGAQRWINVFGIQLQPSEIAKIAIILFFSAYFMNNQDKINNVKTLGIAFLLMAIPLFLIVTQPDLSTTIVTTLIFIALLFVAGLSYKVILIVLGISVPTSIITITYILQKAKTAAETGNYQMGRIMAWLYPTDPRYSSKAIQQQNSIMAIGSGQVWGKGLNNAEATSMNNSNYIIEPQTDFIYAVAGEELGFVGCLVIIILLLLIIFECFMIARKAKDLAGKLICCGMVALIGFQSFVNICVATGLMPNTGIPLPFVSYGLTSLLSSFIGMGIVLNIGLQPKKY